MITVVVMAALLVTCSGALQKDVQEFIEGSYVRRFKTDFAAGIDSVVLQQQGEGHYAITKYSRFSRIKDGAWLPEERHEEKMAGVYDAEKQVINEMKKGKVIHFDREKNMMLIGASAYQKIK